MFSKSIVHSSKHLRMPATSRLLYYDLGMYADDDGYCEWYPVLQMTGGKMQDLDVLKANSLIQVFDNEVLIVSDWKENNLIRSDRYQKSRFTGKYGSVENLNLGIPNDNQMDTQVRLGQGRIENTPQGRVSADKKPENQGFEEWWALYPKKVGKHEAIKSWNKIPSLDGELLARITDATTAQAKSAQWRKNHGAYIPYPATWLNGKRWEDEVEASEELTAPSTTVIK
jgi:hypothetical protein